MSGSCWTVVQICRRVTSAGRLRPRWPGNGGNIEFCNCSLNTLQNEPKRSGLVNTFDLSTCVSGNSVAFVVIDSTTAIYCKPWLYMERSRVYNAALLNFLLSMSLFPSHFFGHSI